MDFPSQDSAVAAGVSGGIAHAMTPLSKSASAASDLRGVNVYRVAIVGALSLKGKEIAEVLRDRKFSRR